MLKVARETLRASGPLWTASLILDRFALPALRLWPDWTVAAETLAEQERTLLRAWGMPEAHVEVTVGHLLYADLRGIDSHGCGMLAHYHRALRSGQLTMAPEIRVVREGETTAVVDGGGGLGHVPAETAMRLAIAKCRAAGVGVVTVRNSGHFGAAGAYAALAAEAGFLGVATSSTAEPALVPTFGVEAKLGTNPIAVAVPAQRNRPFLLDMATSAVPIGRISMHRRRGRAIPAGWAQDAAGWPVTNARRAVAQRRLTPLGGGAETSGYKGYGLAAIVEILSTLLGGGAGQPARQVGHFFLALDPRKFGEDGEFEQNLDELMSSLRATRPTDRRRAVRVPGDRAHASEAERRRSGIPLCRAVVEEIRAVCRASSVAFLLAP